MPRYTFSVPLALLLALALCALGCPPPPNHVQSAADVEGSP